MRRWLARLIRWIARRWFTEDVPVDELRSFLKRHSDRAAAYPQPGAAEAQRWLAGLPERKALVKGRLAAGSGVMLDALAEAGIAPDEVTANLERLLKHVEVKRQAALSLLTTDAPPLQIWREKQAVAWAFSRHARRSGDLRYLNAALKLNDWSYRRLLRFTGRLHRKGEWLAVYLTALAAAEEAATEMLG